jgi:hypothetical protein
MLRGAVSWPGLCSVSFEIPCVLRLVGRMRGVLSERRQDWRRPPWINRVTRPHLRGLRITSPRFLIDMVIPPTVELYSVQLA